MSGFPSLSSLNNSLSYAHSTFSLSSYHGFLHPLATVKILPWTWVTVSVQVATPISFGYITRSRTDRSQGNSIYDIWGLNILSSRGTTPFHIPISNAQDSNLPISLPTPLILFCFVLTTAIPRVWSGIPSWSWYEFPQRLVMFNILSYVHWLPI